MRLCLGYGDEHPFCGVDVRDRASVQELLRTVLEPLEPFFSPHKARVNCPGATAVRFDQTASEVEGLMRPFWGLASLLAGGGCFRGTEWWIQGIKAGTDPENPEYWGYPQHNDQRMVEMCPMGMAYRCTCSPPMASGRLTCRFGRLRLGRCARDLEQSIGQGTRECRELAWKLNQREKVRHKPNRCRPGIR